LKSDDPKEKETTPINIYSNIKDIVKKKNFVAKTCYDIVFEEIKFLSQDEFLKVEDSDPYSDVLIERVIKVLRFLAGPCNIEIVKLILLKKNTL
jgi:hypothetical protein